VCMTYLESTFIKTKQMAGSSPLPLWTKAPDSSDPRSANQASNSAPSFGRAFYRKKILHVEFDRSLLATRHALLETAGFEVISCFSGMAAREVSTGSVHFDLFLVGHAASLAERTELVRWMRSNFPKAAVVALRSRDTDGSPIGDANVIADPEELLTTIVDVLKLR